jgi:C_GCAxxG_C_C family probable redox protein
MCGALSGATMILGAARGRTGLETAKNPSYQLSHEYHDQFKTKFGGTCCRSLNRDKFGSKEQGERCNKIVTEGAELLMNFLIDKGIVSSAQ